MARAVIRAICGLFLLASAVAGSLGCYGGGSPSGPADAPSTQRDGSPMSGDLLRAQQTALPRYALALPTTVRNTSVVYVERLSPDETRVGKPYDYQIKVTNLSDSPIADVLVRERIPRTFKLDRSEPAATLDHDFYAFALGEMGPRETRFVHIYGTPNVQGRLNSCIAVTYTPLLCTTTDIVRPELKIAKEGPESVDICQPITYRYVVRNAGTGTARGVKVEDNLPEGLTTADGQRKVLLDAGDLSAGKSRDFDVRIKALKPGRYASPAVARGPDDEAESEPLATQVGAPRLVIAMTGPRSEYLNRPGTYRVVVTNRGDAPARGATLKFTGSDGITLVEAGPAHGRSPDLELGTIFPGKAVTIDATFRGERAGAMRLVAHASSACADEVAAEVETTVLTAPALRLEVMDVEDPVRVGDSVVYKVTVKNQGTGADHSIRLTATLPEGLLFVKAQGPTEVKATGSRLDFGMLPALDPGASATWQVEARAGGSGEVQFQVSLSSQTLGKPAMETEPTRLYDRP